MNLQKELGIPHDLPQLRHNNNNNNNDDAETKEYLRVAKEIMLENPRLFRAFATGKLD